MRRLVVEALHKAHREDLIGFGKDCLIRPLHERGEKQKRPENKKHAGHPVKKRKKQR